jgi:CRP/FNR family transcriptional regulator, cyclic AMP receptor protein
MLRKNRKIELLANVPLFAGLSKRELGDVALVADELDVPSGKTIIREGERGREFIVIESGTVDVVRQGRAVRQLGAGDWVGEIALIADISRTATVTTTSDTRILVITDRAFAKLVRDVPSITYKVLRSVGERLAADER